jgi:hypothetical protein
VLFDRIRAADVVRVARDRSNDNSVNRLRLSDHLRRAKAAAALRGAIGYGTLPVAPTEGP